MSGFADALNAALIHSLWQDALAAALLWSALALLPAVSAAERPAVSAVERPAVSGVERRLRTANTRYVVSCAALALMALVPIATATALYRRALPADVNLPAASGIVTVRTMAAPLPPVVPVVNLASVVRRPIVPLIKDVEWIAQFQPWALPLWAIGVLLFSLRLVSAGMYVRRLERRSEPAGDAIRRTVALLARRLGVERPVRVLVSSVADGPAMLGWLRPVILLPPAAMLGITPDQLEALLAHELAHIRRHDYLVNVLQMVVDTLFFYHPAVWWASRRIRVERELCCDDIAVASCGDALGYAQALTRVARLRVAEPAVGSASGPLLVRIQRVLGRPTGTAPSPPPWTTAALLVTIVALVLTGERARGAGGQQVFPRAMGAIDGQIVDTQSGKPAPDATVTLDLVRPQISVRIHDGNAVPDINIRLVRSGTVSGRVYDDAGAELSGVEVELLRKMYGNGAAAPVPVAFGQTEGPLSMFQIGDLPPGEYFVRAYLSEPVRPTHAGPRAAYAPTFFPDATRIADAQPIVVSAGQNILSLNITLATVSTHFVSGRLVAPEGASLADTSVELATSLPGPGTDAARPRASVAPDGRFRIPDVTSGEYVLVVRDEKDVAKWLGVHPAVTVDGDVADLEIVAERGAHIDGRFVTDAGSPLPFNIGDTEVALDYGPKSGLSGMDAPVSHVQADGTFSIEGPTGSASLRLRLPRRLPHVVVKSVSLDGADVTDALMDLRAGARQRLEIVVTDRLSGMTGTVTDRTGRPVAYARVVAFPEERSRWDAMRLIQTGFSQRDGQYEVDDLPPGAYRAVAVRSLPLDSWTDPGVLDRLWSLAMPIQLEEGQQRMLALKLSPTPQDLLEPSEGNRK